MKLHRTYLEDFASLLFPELCAACRKSLMANEHLICTACLYQLPFTNFHLQADNIVSRQFWGKIKVEGGYALLYFTKGGMVQNLMHQFKYKGMHKIGNLLGSIAGEQLKNNTLFNTADFIIPVPLHKSRLKHRGYNQSLCFAEGLAQKLSAAIEEDNLVRIAATDTQTQKSRFARFENMKEVFMIKDPDRLAGKRILLVDDVITTGSTLEACGNQLLQVPGLKLSIATLAYAE